MTVGAEAVGSTDALFDDALYASTLSTKLKRCLQLGPRYFASDLPRYFWQRKQLGLHVADFGAVYNAVREFRGAMAVELDMPPRFRDALDLASAAGIRFALPRRRLEAVAAAWWSSRHTRGDVIECGSYLGATALFLALLSLLHDRDGKVYLLDTFSGSPTPSHLDTVTNRERFMPPFDPVARIEMQAATLQVTDRVAIERGLFAETFARLQSRSLTFAFAHIDANLYESTQQSCEFVLPRVAPDGVVVFDDYNCTSDLGARLAIDRFLLGSGAKPAPLCGTSAFIHME